MKISPSILENVKMLSMPDCLQAGSNHRFEYQIRINSETEKEFLNCFVLFQQTRNPNSKRGFAQQSIVIVCKHACSTLAYEVLRRLSETISTLPKYVPHKREDVDGQTLSSFSYDSNLLTVLEVAFQHFDSWPELDGVHTMQLPFFGDFIEFSIPPTVSYYLESDHSSKVQMDDICHLSDGILCWTNLVSVLKPLGLLPHIWMLWELVITGQDILVWAPTAEVCSEVVSALASLTAPLEYKSDYRPYINPYDRDIQQMMDSCKQKYQQREAVHGTSKGNTAGAPPSPLASPLTFFGFSETPPRTLRSNSLLDQKQIKKVNSSSRVAGTGGGSGSGSMGMKETGGAVKTRKHRSNSLIIGITNPFLLRSFAQFENAIFLPGADINHGPKKNGKSNNMLKSFFSSRTHSIDDGVDDINSTDSSSHHNNSTHSLHLQSSEANVSIANYDSSLESLYDLWAENNNNGKKKNRNVLVVIRRPTYVTPDYEILNRIMNNFAPSMKGKEGAITDESDLEELDKIAIVGDMLLREHFRQLTFSLMKPFHSLIQMTREVLRGDITNPPEGPSHRNSPDHFSDTLNNTSENDGDEGVSETEAQAKASFKLNPALSKLIRKDNPISVDPLIIPPMPDETNPYNMPRSPKGKMVSRRFIWIYENPKDVFGDDNAALTIDRYFQLLQQHNHHHHHTSDHHIPVVTKSNVPSPRLPTSLSQIPFAKRRQMYILFSHTDAFKSWYERRRCDIMFSIIYHIAEACGQLSDTSIDVIIPEHVLESIKSSNRRTSWSPDNNNCSSFMSYIEIQKLALHINDYVQEIRKKSEISSQSSQLLIQRMINHLHAIINQIVAY